MRIVAHRRSHGSTLLLVLAALLLSLILGISYLEVARQDRKATLNLRTADDIDAVTDSVISLALTRLYDDLGVQEIGATGLIEYFAVPDDESVTNTNPAEPFDYPGDRDTWLAESWPEPPPLTGNPQFYQVSRLDPTVDFFTQSGASTDTIRSLQTELMNIYLSTAPWDAADADGDGIIDSKPQIAPIASLNGVDYFMWVRIIDNSSMLNLNTALVANEQFNSADNEHYPRGYNSSEVSFGLPFENRFISTHGSQETFYGRMFGLMTDNATPYAEMADFLAFRLGSDTPYDAMGTMPMPNIWYEPYPGGAPTRNALFLTHPESVSSPPPTDRRKDLLAATVIAYDDDLDSSNDPAPFTRADFWQYGASQYDNYGGFNLKFGFESELELRYRNGLNNLNYNAPIEGLIDPMNPTMPDPTNIGLPFLLRSEAVEATSEDLILPNGAAVIWTDYFESNARTNLTTISGHSIYRPSRGVAVVRPLKSDINRYTTQAGVNPALKLDLKTEILDLLQAGTVAFTPPGTVALDEYATQLTASIIDYADADDLLGTLPDADGSVEAPIVTGVALAGGGNVRYGLEALPFISEAYIQHAYDAQGTATAPPVYNVTWTRQDPIGFAVELSNPFHRRISLNGIRIQFQVTTDPTTNYGFSLEEYMVAAGQAGWPNELRYLGPGESIAIHMPSTANPIASDEIEGSSGIYTDPSSTPDYTRNVRLDLATLQGLAGVGTVPAWLNSPENPVTIELRAPTGQFAGDHAGYQRVDFLPILTGAGGSVAFTGPAIRPGGVPAREYYQRWAIGTGEGINMLTARQTDFHMAKGPAVFSVPGVTLPPPVPGVPEFFPGQRDLATDRFAVPVKGVATALGYAGAGNIATGAGGDPPIYNDRHQILIADYADEKLREIGELAMIAILGFETNVATPPVTTKTIPEIWHEMTSGWTNRPDSAPYYLALSPDSTEAPYTPITTTAEQVGQTLMHGQIILDHFTSLHPGGDGLDNDGDGMWDESETDGMDNDIPPNGLIDALDPAEANNNEQFIPGTLNLNTVPRFLLESLLPVPTQPLGAAQTLRQKIAGAIWEYRSAGARGAIAGSTGAPTQRKAGLRQEAGFYSVGEFFHIYDGEMAVDALAADSYTSQNRRIDFHPENVLIRSAAAPGTWIRNDSLTAGGDGIADDQEERTLLGRWLGQVGAVRSDVFTAHILVRGYRGNSPVPESEQRSIVVIDRSQINMINDRPRILGRFDY